MANAPRAGPEREGNAGHIPLDFFSTTTSNSTANVWSTSNANSEPMSESYSGGYPQPVGTHNQAESVYDMSENDPIYDVAYDHMPSRQNHPLFGN